MYERERKQMYFGSIETIISFVLYVGNMYESAPNKSQTKLTMFLY